MMQATEVGRRTRVIRPYPSYTLQEALSVARAIHDSNAGLPFDRELLAQALGTTPKSSGFTTRLNASAAYGLTEGGYNDAVISITELGEAVVASTGSDAVPGSAVAAAATNPDIFGRFYEMLNGRRLPQSANLHSILQRDLEVRADLTVECLDILRSNGEFAGIITEVAGEYCVNLPEAGTAPQTGRSPGMIGAELPTPYETRAQPDTPALRPALSETNRIFIGHVGESDAARYVASMLDEFGILSAGSHIQEDGAGLLMPQEVSRAMRDSSAAILVFRDDDDAWRSRDKMLSMLGAASVLFDDRVVMLHEGGARLSIGADGLNHVDFDHERPGESALNLLVALHKAGVISVTAP